MPYLHIQIGQKATAEQIQAIAKGCEGIISILPGKTVDNCMVRIENDCDMYMKGEKNACVFVEIRLYKPSPAENKTQYAKAIYDVIHGVLGTTPGMFYMNFLEMSEWAAGGVLK